ncbi:MAG: hypothetical protein U0838_05050 [Chloroflexota bacterium]
MPGAGEPSAIHFAPFQTAMPSAAATPAASVKKPLTTTLLP